MARAHFRDIVVDRNGNALPAASVRVEAPATGETLTWPLYAAESGDTTLSNPLTSDGDGIVDFYLSFAQRVQLRVSKAGYAEETALVDVGDPSDVDATPLKVAVFGYDGTEKLTAANPGVISGTVEVAAIGATTDAEATADGTVVALLKRLRTLLGSILSVKLAQVTASPLQATKQSHVIQTCAAKDVDNDVGAIPAWATYVEVWGDDVTTVAVGEATVAATLGAMLPANCPRTYPIISGGDGHLHVQSGKDGGKVWATFLSD